jgi:hypothetical protein
VLFLVAKPHAFRDGKHKAPHILILVLDGEWVVSFLLRLLNPRGDSPQYTLDRRIGVPESQSGRGKRKGEAVPVLFF